MTGGGTGLGKGMSLKFSQLGAKVILKLLPVCITVLNGFIITWILNQIFMFSNEIKLVDG